MNPGESAWLKVHFIPVATLLDKTKTLLGSLSAQRAFLTVPGPVAVTYNANAFSKTSGIRTSRLRPAISKTGLPDNSHSLASLIFF